jgi:hypothetical protein
MIHLVLFYFYLKSMHSILTVRILVLALFKIQEARCLNPREIWTLSTESTIMTKISRHCWDGSSLPPHRDFVRGVSFSWEKWAILMKIFIFVKVGKTSHRNIFLWMYPMNCYENIYFRVGHPNTLIKITYISWKYCT